MRTHLVPKLRAHPGRRLVGMALVALWAAAPAARAQSPQANQAAVTEWTIPTAAGAADAAVLEAREALRRKDRSRLAELRALTAAQRHPLALWVDYWDISLRLNELAQADLDAFYARWPGSYVEDRLRNDWLLELGRRRDWANVAREFPRFRMNDDREVTCYALLADHGIGRDVREAAVAAWMAQRDADTGCHLLASTLFDARRLGEAEIWQKLRTAVDGNRPRAARQAASLLGPAVAASVGEAFDAPAKLLGRLASQAVQANAVGQAVLPDTAAELAAYALARRAAAEPPAVASQLAQTWAAWLGPERAAWAWAATAKQAAMDLEDGAPGYYAQAWAALPRETLAARWGDDKLAWNVRAALRAGSTAERWKQVQRAVEAMSDEAQRDPAWQYWRARALAAQAADGPAGEAQRAASRAGLETLAGQMHFYGKLALEDLGRSVVLPQRPLPPTAAEREAAAASPGLSRSLHLIAIGLRNEGVREWNFALRGLDDRALLAAAQRACDREVWDRCINTSDRTRGEVDMAQRFPMPFRQDVVAASREIGLDPSYVYGLIRQESRFIMDARSSVGASGLMQLMPATARWTAKRIGLDYSGDMITDRDVNLRLGTAYLKLVLDDFNGSQALATAAYNAGPNRPRRWRNGPVVDPAVWAENIPFTETRDYVKKVLSNAVYYSALLTGRAPTLKSRLGPDIGPRAASAGTPNRDLP